MAQDGKALLTKDTTIPDLERKANGTATTDKCGEGAHQYRWRGEQATGRATVAIASQSPKADFAIFFVKYAPDSGHRSGWLMKASFGPERNLSPLDGSTDCTHLAKREQSLHEIRCVPDLSQRKM